MRKLLFTFSVTVCMLCAASFLNAEDDGVYLNPAGKVVINGKVIKGATIMLSVEGDVIITNHNGNQLEADSDSRNFSSGLPCEFVNLYIPSCNDNCTDGYACDDTCSYCVEIEPEGCRSGYFWDGGGCYDDCDESSICDSFCNDCVSEDNSGCTLGFNGCVDNCADYLECDDSCAWCVPDSICGDGVIESYEECDPPGSDCTTVHGSHPGTCDDECYCIVQSECGNLVIEEGEECDPPGSDCSTSSGDAGTCDDECYCVANCGNGVTSLSPLIYGILIIEGRKRKLRVIEGRKATGPELHYLLVIG